jgi:cellulose synthase/poly-beta-1,6-N-acetylglucosamine synthase-like glycosyltransferase
VVDLLEITRVFYTWPGFPLLLAMRARLLSRPVEGVAHAEPTPSLRIAFAAYNERSVIREKLESLRELDHPFDGIQIIVASDDSSDATLSPARAYADSRVEILELPRVGKNHALNAALERARAEIVIFTNADAIFAPDALRALVAPFSNPHVGAVGGDLRYAPASE